MVKYEYCITRPSKATKVTYADVPQGYRLQYSEASSFGTASQDNTTYCYWPRQVRFCKCSALRIVDRKCSSFQFQDYFCSSLRLSITVLAARFVYTRRPISTIMIYCMYWDTVYDIALLLCGEWG